MKYYKLIKEYPGSPKLGTIWNQYFTDCPKFPEFWEETDYEILSFIYINNKTILYKSKRGTFIHNPENISNGRLEIDLLANKLYSIHSVKRLTDGTIFTIGDMIKSNNHKICVIKTITYYNKIILNVTGNYFYLSDAEKIDNKKYTTDSIDIIKESIKDHININKEIDIKLVKKYNDYVKLYHNKIIK